MKMKNIIGIFCFLVFSFCAFLDISAQEMKIGEQEITTLRKNASEKLELKSYRVKMNSKSYANVNDSAPSYFSNEITEYMPPNSYHYVSEIKNGNKITREETIEIGDRKFTRLSNGKWEKVTSAENGFGGGFGASIVENKETVEYKYKGKQIFNSQNADLYEIKTQRKYKSKNGEYIRISFERFWFDKNGLFLKTENESFYDGKVISHTVREYEYDPNIKIVAPIK